jgi:Chaperone of endosialidase
MTSGAVDAMQRKATTIVNVARVICARSYHFVVAVWSKRGRIPRMMKTNMPSLVLLTLLTFFAPLPGAHAVLPTPDGGYGPPDYGAGNTAEGENALLGLTSGTYNTAVGWSSLESVTTGSLNTGIGAGTLGFDTADLNTAIGAGALFLNTTGANNTATGAIALYSNTTGESNTANGAYALARNTTADFNTAIGALALTNNTTGRVNTGVGANTLATSTTADLNTAIGGEALRYNTTGGTNTGVGFQALVNTSTGSANTGVGFVTLLRNTTGGQNTALGYAAGRNLTTGENNIDIGYLVGGAAGESNTIRIGNEDITSTYISGISGQTATGGAAVFVNSNGKLGTMTSSKRFKDEIKPMSEVSEAVLALKPVTFCYKKEIDPARTSQFGLLAEDVEKVNPDLVVRDKEGKPYTVRYEAVNAMLLNEFLKEHNTVQELKKEVAALIATVKEQAAQIQKVSAQLELSKAAPQTVKNND